MRDNAPVRIALYDKKLFQSLQAFEIPQVELELLNEKSNPCNSDILFLQDKEVKAVAEQCTSVQRPSFFVLVDEKGELPESFVNGIADDLLALPARRVDLIRLIRLHYQIQGLREVENTSKAIPMLVSKLQEDLHLAQKIQRRLIKDKFPAMSGIKIKSKYWCGMKSGGDYFDAFEFPDGNHVGILLSDSSSYSLSSNFLGSLMQFSLHTGSHDPQDPAKVVEALYGKIKDNMKEKDEFSLFYGILNRKTYQFRTVSCGKAFAFHQSGNNKTWLYKGESPALTKTSAVFTEAKEVLLEPTDRLLLLSDGWKNSLKSPLAPMAEDLLQKYPDAQDLVNNFAFSLRKSVESELDEAPTAEDDFPMPPEDCSILVVDVAKNVLRLAKNSG